MAYFIDLFSPETYEAFARSSRDVSGFRLRHQRMAERVSPGDVFVCYLTVSRDGLGFSKLCRGHSSTTRRSSCQKVIHSLSDSTSARSCGSTSTRLFRFTRDLIWAGLSFTRGLEKGSIAWTGKVRGSLVRPLDRDGKFLAEQLTAQSIGGRLYPLDEQESRKLRTHTVTRTDKVVTVSVPDDVVAMDEAIITPEAETRESIRVEVYPKFKTNNRHVYGGTLLSLALASCRWTASGVRSLSA